MKYLENMKEVTKLSPDFLGFIFYSKSPRYMVDTLEPGDVKNIPSHIKKAGVFVDESLSVILESISLYSLDLVQLHGHESPEFCKQIKEAGTGVIKVFHVGDVMDWKLLDDYVDYVDYFLFDTQSKNYGGTGKSFNWDILKGYVLDVPYFLSGGVGLENIDQINRNDIRKPFALDVNSRFEVKPGSKNVEQLNRLIEKLALAF